MIAELLNIETVAVLSDQMRAALNERILRSVPHGPEVAASLEDGRGRDAQPTVGDVKAFVPAHPTMSLLQALLDERAHEATERPGPSAVTPRPAFRVEPIPGPHLPVLARSQFARDQPPELSVRFGKLDPGWLEIFAELAETMARRLTFDLPDAPPAVFDLPEDARVILVGDWGTGGPDAEAVAARIADALDEAAARQCHLIHLGDIYYAGTRWESKRRFLDKWPIHTKPPPDHHSWTLNGNHDMYSAAEGLFQTVLPDPRFAHQRTIDHAPTTQFHLQTKRWQILGLDSSFRFDPQDPTGLHGSLGDRQRRWLTDCCSDRTRSTIVLTHHQPFSRTRRDAPLELNRHLLNDTREARSIGDGIAAWFWGHEHRCITYPEPAGIDGLRYGACVGHGAMPQEPIQQPIATGNEWEFDETKTDAEGHRWRKCGFAVIDFHPDAAPTVTYRDQDGHDCRNPDQLDGTTA